MLVCLVTARSALQFFVDGTSGLRVPLQNGEAYSRKIIAILNYEIFFAMGDDSCTINSEAQSQHYYRSYCNMKSMTNKKRGNMLFVNVMNKMFLKSIVAHCNYDYTM